MNEPMTDSPQAQSPQSPLDLPRPSFAEMVVHALIRSVIGSAVVSLIVVAWVSLRQLGQGVSPEAYSLLTWGGATFLFTLIVWFVISFVRQSRALSNRAFTVVGFGATFFGLAMLVVFFGGLFRDVAHWFYYQPLLINQTNWLIEKNRKELEDAQALYDQRRAALLRELKEALVGIDDEKEKEDTIRAYLGPKGTIDSKDSIQQPGLAELRKEALAAIRKARTTTEKDVLYNKYHVQLYGLGGAFANELWYLEKTIDEKRDVANMPLRTPTGTAAFNDFLLETPSPYPESVGIRPALLGSLWIAFIMILFSVPIGVGAALYLEEYRSEGRLARLIQININNLAGVPSIVFGILGAFVFVEMIFKPIHLLNHNISVRNLIGGGLTLALLTLPVVIVSAQEAIRAVPNSIRQGAYALGATHWQVIWHQVLPMARPGILTGTILSVSRAIGEAAPLVLFGATTFIAYNPSPVSDFTVLPIQIYNWAERSTNPTIDRIAGVTAEGNVSIFEAMSGRTLGRLRGHEGAVNSVSFNRSGARLVTSGEDGTVRTWDSHTYRPLAVLRGHSGPVTAAVIIHNPERDWILSGDRNGQVVLWKSTSENYEDSKVVLPAHKSAVSCMARSIDGTRAVTGSADRTLVLWDLKKGKAITNFTGHSRAVTAVCFGPDGTILSAGEEGTVRQWDEKGTELKLFEGGHQGMITGIAYAQTNDYKRLITGGVDRKVLAWDFADGKIVQTFPEHGDAVTAVDVIQRQINGYEFIAVVSGSKDQTLRYSELVTGKEMQTMQGRNGAITSVAIDPAGLTVEAWHNNMALASLVLLFVLLLLNAVAIVLRNRAQKRVRV